MGVERIHGYAIAAPLYESSQSVVYRGRRLSDGRAVVIKLLHDEYPSPARVLRFQREFAIARRLAGEGIAEALALLEVRHTAAIVWADSGGESLARLRAQRAFAPAEVLRVALAAAAALGRVHAARIIHKDLNPANIVYNPATGVVELIDFGISTALSREQPDAAAPQALEGTLAYISPEQTGRMNRGTDYRTDLYSLGATLYHLVAGRPPFVADDPLELIHCHLARLPEPLDAAPSRSGDLWPPALAAMVRKLMAKTAEERYQSAAGLAADLERCLDGLEGGESGPFELGRDDRSDRFHVPERLYGRERETEALLAAFERAGEGAASLVLVPGTSGIGKSSLIHEVHRPITARRGRFAAGKFDQYRRDIPYTAFIQAFRGLLGQILTGGDEEVAAWRRRLGAALGPNARVLVNVVPEVALVTGDPGEVPALPPLEAQNRFNLVFRSFVGAFAAERPLVLVLDDVQWADAASLKLIAELAAQGERRHLLLVCAYRDNEVDAAHPFALTLHALESGGAPITTISPQPLLAEHVIRLVADTVHRPAGEAEPLARLCLEKTAGNPFFLGRFLETLHAEGLLVFDPATGAFGWDLDAIRRVGITSNVVELMAARITRLPEGSRRALRLAAAVGATFDLGTLAIAAARPRTAVAADLAPALAEGLITPSDAGYQFVVDDDDRLIRYRFVHDRVQQAAYAGIPEGELPGVHLGIGRLLLGAFERAGTARAESLFEVVTHLNLGRSLITAAAEREALARLNLAAGTRAMASAAYAPALFHLRTGIDLLGPDGWERRYELSLALVTGAAQAASLAGELPAMERFVDEVLRRARALLDRVPAYEARCQAYLNHGRFRDGLRVGVEVLKLLGVDLPLAPSKARVAAGLVRMRLALVGKSIEGLADLPPMTAPDKLAAMRVMSGIASAVYSTASAALPLLVFELVRISVTFGTAPESAVGYAGYALALCVFLGDIPTGHRFGRLALRLAERPEMRRIRAKVIFQVNCFVEHWSRPIRETLEPALLAYRVGLETGDLEYATYSALVFCGHALFAGYPLADIEREAVGFTQAMRRTGDPGSVERLRKSRQWTQNLMGLSPDPRRLSGAVCDEDEILAAIRAKADEYAEASLWVNKVQLAFLFGDPRAALVHADQAERLAHRMVGTCELPILVGNTALAALAVARDAEGSERRRLVARATAARRRMERWAEQAPENNGHWVALIDAELAHTAGDSARARESYDRAVALARRHRFVNQEGLANELAARFYLSIDKPRVAEVYLVEAHHAWLRWGAAAKAHALEAEHPALFARRAAPLAETSIATSISTSTGRHGTAELDLLSVTKASQAISGEILLDNLVPRLLRTLLESAGAQRGLLFVLGDARLVVELDLDGGGAASLHPEAAAGDPPSYCSAMVRYVERTREAVVLGDATAAGPFQDDPYIEARRPRSVLAMPVVRQQSLFAVLYLENQLAAFAFTPERLRVLEILSAQAAISLEHAQLVDTLESRVRDRTGALTGALERLRETQQQLILKEKLASLGTLTSGIAHEIKNPLNFVTNFAELSVGIGAELREELDRLRPRLDPEAAGYVDELVSDLVQNVSKIQEHGRRADAIVRGMLEHSRGRTGEARSVDLNALVRSYTSAAVQGHAPGAPPAAAVALHLDEAVGEVRLVPEGIGRVVLNLVNNALYAAQAGKKARGEGSGAAVTVTTRAAGDMVEILVRDTGLGIPAAIRDKIYTPFFTTKRSGEGAGLGLSLSYDIVVQGHGGALTFTSEEGDHTEFVIALPRRNTAA